MQPNKRPKETPPMLINEISRLFFDKMRAGDVQDPLLPQHACRLLLRALCAEDGVRQSDLCRATHLKAPTVSTLLREMEKNGLVLRRADGGDRRATRIHLTEKGLAADKNIRARLREVDGILMRDLSPEDERVLLTLLRRMRDNILTDLHGTKGEAET